MVNNLLSQVQFISVEASSFIAATNKTLTKLSFPHRFLNFLIDIWQVDSSNLILILQPSYFCLVLLLLSSISTYLGLLLNLNIVRLF